MCFEFIPKRFVEFSAILSKASAEKFRYTAEGSTGIFAFEAI